MWRMEIGLTMFWFIPLMLGFVIALIFMRFSYRQLDEDERGEPVKAGKEAPEDKNDASPATS